MTENIDPRKNDAHERSDAPDTQDVPGDSENGKNPESGDARRPRVVVASSEGVHVADPQQDPTADVEEPAKVMRIGTMLKQLLEEVKSAPLDEAARDRLAEVHARSVAELRDGLSEDLADELDRITLPFTDNTPSDAELRIAQAQLVGWLEGLFHGIQTALVAQQVTAQNQLQSMRRSLPRGAAPGSGLDTGQDHPRPGQYL